MNNTYFILSNKKISIERLHICTWDFVGSNAAFEIGFEFMPTPYVKDVEIIEAYDEVYGPAGRARRGRL